MSEFAGGADYCDDERVVRGAAYKMMIELSLHVHEEGDSQSGDVLDVVAVICIALRASVAQDSSSHDHQVFTLIWSSKQE
jgi:hypothetical protein